MNVYSCSHPASGSPANTPQKNGTAKSERKWEQTPGVWPPSQGTGWTWTEMVNTLLALEYLQYRGADKSLRLPRPRTQVPGSFIPPSWPAPFPLWSPGTVSLPSGPTLSLQTEFRASRRNNEEQSKGNPGNSCQGLAVSSRFCKTVLVFRIHPMRSLSPPFLACQARRFWRLRAMKGPAGKGGYVFFLFVCEF